MSTTQDRHVGTQQDAEMFVGVVREGPALEPHQVEDIIGGLEAGFANPTGKSSVAIALGEGVRVSVRNGQLRVEDGVGWNRRVRRWPRAGSSLKRLVVGAASGMLTLDAIEWCRTIGVALVVVDQEGDVVLAPGTYGHSDARLRRAQATASEELSLSVAIGLIMPKILGQAGVAATRLARQDIAEDLRDIASCVDACSTIDELRQLEATAAGWYFGAWQENLAAIPRFTKAETKRVPAHWCAYDGRRSLLSSKGNTNRKADRPMNAVLNYLYKVAEIETRLACIAVGLDPGLGILLHLDAAGRDSLVFDLMEPLRPEVERFALDLMAEATFSRKDFVERTDGSVKIGPALAQRLAATLPTWGRSVAPHAEQVAHEFGRVVAGKWEARTPLTGRKAKAAAALVKARKANAIVKGKRSSKLRSETPCTNALSFAGCVDCGAALERPRHIRCSRCWEAIPGQAREVRQRRGRAISQTRSAQEQWSHGNPDAKFDPEDFRRLIMPGLSAVPLAKIVSTINCSKTSASSYRSGRTVPHPMYWQSLSELARPFDTPIR